ncbi:MAG: hypothetical protein SFV22_19500 [Saprospiraceae bacterium]|nr:hypothetical protein [Saprospiraceae bacterium]
MRYPVLLLVFALPAFFSAGKSAAQTVISLKNPGFEADGRAAGTNITGWINLGANDETPPDIQPGWFGVKLPAQEGDNYIGLVVRETGTWEGIGQRLSSVMEKGSSYSFSVWLARCNTYSSPLRGGGEPKQFTAPTILKIWGYNTRTAQEELLAESTAIGHSKWVLYEFELSPSLADYDEIDLMVYYAPGYENQNGNLLLDACSNLVKIEK